jgi:glycosyltransferase involved in cell wall biosynthesis
VSPSHVAANPRLVKEADALHAAGYAVHVVAGWHHPALDEHDRSLYARAPWSRTVVYGLTGPRVLIGKVRRNLARKRLAAGAHPNLPLATRAIHATTHLLAAAALRARADLYIGHTVAGLAAAALAAQKAGVPFAFDAEDFHRAETDYAIHDRGLATAIATIESQLLPRCAHVTAASPLIAGAYRQQYGIPLPATVLNTFPREEAPDPSRSIPPAGRTPSLYWFSQTIGPGRGLEAWIRVMARLARPCDLHLRGLPAPGFVDTLEILAEEVQFKGRLQFHPPAPPREMARLAAPFDLGLSLEQPTPLNRDLCLTNKVFTYLLAGIPQVMTPTRAQRDLAEELGCAALLLDPSDAAGSAAALDTYLADPIAQRTARDHAWHLGQSRFNWEIEQTRLLETVGRALARDVRRPASVA